MPDWKQDVQKIKGGTAIAEPNWQEDLAAIKEPMFRTTPSVSLLNDPNDVSIRAKESLEVADTLELPLIQAEEIADALDGEKIERPGFIKRAIFGFVNKALIQPAKNIFKFGGIGKLDIDLEVFGEIRRIKEEEGREVSDEEFINMYERMKVKVERRTQAALPALQLPPAKGVAEKGLEIATGLGAFVSRLILARKFVGGKGIGAEIAAFEVVNQVDNGPPGLGILLAGSLGLIGKVPAATLGGKGLKLAGQGGALASVTAIRGGEPEDIAVAFFLPSILHTFNQFPNLIKGKAWDIKTAKGARELGMFKGVPLKNIKQWSAAMRDAAKVKLGNMTPKAWGAKHGKNLQDFSNRIGKTYDDIVTSTKLPSAEQVREGILQNYLAKIQKEGLRKPVVKPPTVPIPAPEKPVAGRKAEIAPTAKQPWEMTYKEFEKTWDKYTKPQNRGLIPLKEGETRPLHGQGNDIYRGGKLVSLGPKEVYKRLIEQAPTAKPEGIVKAKYDKASIQSATEAVKRTSPNEDRYIYATAEGFVIDKNPPIDKNQSYRVVHPDYSYEDVQPFAEGEEARIASRRKVLQERVRRGEPIPEPLLREFKAEKWAQEALAKPEVAKVEKPKPKIPPLSKETKDILGGVEPISQIHKALSAAKAVRPITEAAKKEAIRKRVGAAAGALRENLRKGMLAEQAIQLSTGLLKGPLTEYTQLYESIEDTLDPEVKNTARLMIAQHPDLKYFEVVNTDKSFTKLIQGSSLTPNEAAQIERVFGKAFEEQLAKVTTKSDLYDRLITYWKATLLTGLKTSGLNILSTAGHAMTETAKDVPAALIDSGIYLVTGERKVAFTVKGYPTGWVEGLGKGWRYMRTGYDERNVGEKYDYKKTNYGMSKIARTIQAITEFVFHLLGAEDQPWFYGAYSRSLHSQAIAQAKTKRLKGKAKKDFINNLQKNPTDEMLIWAKEDADTAIYTNRTNLGDLGKAIQKVKGGEIIVPFSRTPSAVAMQIINYSPVGVVKEIAHEIHEGKFNQRKFSHAAGRTVVGTAALYLGAQLFKAGLIALGYPDNERERKLWELEGRKPNSIKVGDEWRDIQAFGPTGNLLVIGGYFQQALDSKGSPTEAMIEAMAGGAKSFTEQTFVRGVNLAVDALTDPERSFERWFTSMSGSLVPTIVADIARAQDDRARRAVGPKERIQSRIPIYRKGLPPKIDVFGQDLPRYGGNVFETMIDPTRPSKIRQDVVVDELRRLWDKDIKVSPTLLGDKAGYDILTKEENTQLWQRAGELTYKALFGLVNAEDYEKANDFAKGQLVEFITRQAKAAAKAEIVNIKLKQGKTVLKLAESGLLSIDSLEALKYFQESEKP